MADLINGRTPEEIKRILKWLDYSCGNIECEECEYSDICNTHTRVDIERDALALIEHLEAQRDEAIKAIAQRCEFCKHWHNPPIVTEGKDGCLTVSYCEEECKRVLNGYSGFEWRGFSKAPKEENV